MFDIITKLGIIIVSTRRKTCERNAIICKSRTTGKFNGTKSECNNYCSDYRSLFDQIIPTKISVNSILANNKRIVLRVNGTGTYFRFNYYRLEILK